MVYVIAYLKALFQKHLKCLVIDIQNMDSVNQQWRINRNFCEKI